MKRFNLIVKVLHKIPIKINIIKGNLDGGKGIQGLNINLYNIG